MKARSQAKPKRYRRYDSTGLSGTLEALPRPQLRHISGKWIVVALIAAAGRQARSCTSG